jgi:hypothetical protein
MQKFTYLLLAGFILFQTVKGQNEEAGKKAVNQTIIDLFQGFSDLDLQKIKSHCTPDFLLFENGAIWNTDSLAPGINRRKSQPDFSRVNKFGFIRTEVRGNTAWTSYTNQAEMTSAGKGFRVKWLESAVLIRTGKEWKIKFLHSTLLERTEL